MAVKFLFIVRILVCFNSQLQADSKTLSSIAFEKPLAAICEIKTKEALLYIKFCHFDAGFQMSDVGIMSQTSSLSAPDDSALGWRQSRHNTLLQARIVTSDL